MNKKIVSPYLDLKRLKKPKDDFKNCINILKKKIKLDKKKIIDIGCANGEFLNFMISKYPNNYYCGVDINKSFLKIARKNNNLKKVKFINKNFVNVRIKSSFDIAICMGVSHSITNIDKLVSKLSSFVKKNGLIIIDGFFNDYDIDTKIYFKDYSNKKKKWQNDFNHFSKYTLSKILKKNKIRKYSFHNSFPNELFFAHQRSYPRLPLSLSSIFVFAFKTPVLTIFLSSFLIVFFALRKFVLINKFDLLSEYKYSLWQTNTLIFFLIAILAGIANEYTEWLIINALTSFLFIYLCQNKNKEI